MDDETILRHDSEVLSLAFSADGTTLASLSGEGKVWLWDVSTGKSIRSFGSTLQGLRLSPDGLTLASRSPNGIEIWSLDRAERLSRLPGLSSDIAFSADGKILAFAREEQLTYRELKNGKEAQNWLHLYEVSTGQERRLSEKGTVIGLAFAPNSNLLATTHGRRQLWEDVKRMVRLWDVATGKEVRTLQVDDGHASYVGFLSDGRMLASAGLKGIELWDPATGNPIKTLRGRVGLGRVEFSAHAEMVAHGDDDVRIWNIATEREVLVIAGTPHGRVFALSPNGRTVATRLSERVVRLIDIPSER